MSLAEATLNSENNEACSFSHYRVTPVWSNYVAGYLVIHIVSRSVENSI